MTNKKVDFYGREISSGMTLRLIGVNDGMQPRHDKSGFGSYIIFENLSHSYKYPIHEVMSENVYSRIKRYGATVCAELLNMRSNDSNLIPITLNDDPVYDAPFIYDGRLFVIVSDVSKEYKDIKELLY